MFAFQTSYKRFRLKNGATPVEEFIRAPQSNKKSHGTLCTNEGSVSGSTTSNKLDIVESNKGHDDNLQSSDVNQTVESNIQTGVCGMDVDDVESTKHFKAENEDVTIQQGLSFDDLSSRPINLPNNWTKAEIKSRDGSRVIHIYHSVFETIDDEPVTVLLKEVFISSDLTYQLKSVGKVLDKSKFDLVEKLETIEDVQELILAFHFYSICEGYKIGNEFLNSVAYRDIYNTVRHVKCEVIVVQGKRCKYCNNLRRSINKRRASSNENVGEPVPAKRIRLSKLPQHEKQKIEEMHKEKISLTKQCKRTIKSNKSLRSRLSETQKKLSQISNDDLQKIFASENISENQKEAVKQIIEASKHSNSKGHRYSENWLILCLLFHMRSPRGYRFSYDEKILPIPCVRTIRR